MPEQNPFVALGIPPECIEELSDTEILTVVDGRVKALARLFHPDVTGGTTTDPRLLAVNTAKEELEIPVLFTEAKRKHLSKLNRPAKLERFELAIHGMEWHAHAHARAAVTAPTDEENYRFGLRVLAAYVLSMAQGRMGRVQKWKEWNGWAVGIFRPPPCSILLEDNLVELAKVALARKHHKPSRHTKRQSSYAPTLFEGKTLELVMRPDGTVQSYPVERLAFRPGHNEIPADIPKEWVFGNQSTSGAGSYYYRRSGEATPFPGKLLGCIQLVEPLHNIAELKYWHRLVIKPTPDQDDYLHCLNGFSAEEFAPVAPYVLPVIAPSEPLVAFMSDGPEQRFKIFERVILIRMLGKTDKNQGGAPAPNT